jgi:hypothetical protein
MGLNGYGIRVNLIQPGEPHNGANSSRDARLRRVKVLRASVASGGAWEVCTGRGGRGGAIMCHVPNPELWRCR